MLRRMLRLMPAFLLSAALATATNDTLAREAIVVGGTGSPLGSVQLLADAYMHTHPDTDIAVLPSLGSGGGIKALGAGKIDLALSTRLLTPEEEELGLRASIFATTPIIFATNAENAETGVSLAWVAGAYDGSFSRWPSGDRIRLVLRPLNDSDSVVLSEMSELVKTAFGIASGRPGFIVADDAQVAADALESLQGSLGTSTLTQVLSEKRFITPLALDGIVPSVATLSDGSYPFGKAFYLVTGPRTSGPATDFVRFIGSDAGKSILLQYGSIPQN
jgi:phosphate transport system substrate-binding protein